MPTCQLHPGSGLPAHGVFQECRQASAKRMSPLGDYSTAFQNVATLSSLCVLRLVAQPFCAWIPSSNTGTKQDVYVLCWSSFDEVITATAIWVLLVFYGLSVGIVNPETGAIAQLAQCLPHVHEA